MATKKKTKKKPAKAKKTAAKKVTRTKVQAKKRGTPKKLAKKKSAPKVAAKKRAVGKKAAGGKILGAARKKTRARRERPAAAFSRERPESRSGEQSGDLQGLSNIEGADSESVDELLEEGNAFEAGIVRGVEEAEDQGEQEVRTREVPEDDVPEEYLDKDR
jgi:hypothetical protein